MYTAQTHGVTVEVEPRYLEDRSDPDAGRYVWAYSVTVTNGSPRAAQLVARYWRITDGRGHIEEVRGPGVVGEQPILKPGESFRYTSGCPLTTPSGFMSGAYQMVDDSGASFEIVIPTFSLDAPSGARVLN